MNMASITIYHNPACGTSRNTRALIRNRGTAPEVIAYLKTPPTKARLCRASKAVLDILPDPQRAAFNKEDGEAVVNAQGQRV